MIRQEDLASEIYDGVETTYYSYKGSGDTLKENLTKIFKEIKKDAKSIPKYSNDIELIVSFEWDWRDCEALDLCNKRSCRNCPHAKTHAHEHHVSYVAGVDEDVFRSENLPKIKAALETLPQRHQNLLMMQANFEVIDRKTPEQDIIMCCGVVECLNLEVNINLEQFSAVKKLLCEIGLL